MLLRIDKDILADGGEGYVTAGSAINWLRYMEITHSWTKINVDNWRTNDAGHYRRAGRMVKPRSLISELYP